jgi:hypothetical protein
MKPTTKILIFLCACLLVAGCGKGGNTNNSSNATSNTANTMNAAASPKATPEAAKSPVEAASANASKPEAAAEGLFDAWADKDRTAAAKFASEAAVAKLFRDGGGPEGMEFQGCEKESGGYTCGYYYEGGGLIMHVKGSEAAGYKVDSVEFIAD